MAVAEFRRAQRVERLGVGRELGCAERLNVLRDSVFFHRCRQGWGDAYKAGGNKGHNQVTTIDVHCFLPLFHASSFGSSYPYLIGAQ
jgi:hypothetical protein